MTLSNYAAAHTTPEDSLLRDLVRHTHLHVMHPRMLSGHIQGKLLEQIVWMMRPQHILEIGTFTGYTTLCLAKGLPANGILHTIEINDELHSVAAAHIAGSEKAGQIKLHIGNALDIISTLPGTFDLVYIDGNKREYTLYYHAVFPKLHPGGFIIADNVWWDGKVTDPAALSDAQTKGIVEFNETVRHDARVENVFLPLRDGLSIIRKKNENHPNHSIVDGK